MSAQVNATYSTIFKNLLLLSIFLAQRMVNAEIPPIPIYVQNRTSFLFSRIFISPNVIGIEIRKQIIHFWTSLFFIFPTLSFGLTAVRFFSSWKRTQYLSNITHPNIPIYTRNCKLPSSDSGFKGDNVLRNSCK